MGLATPVLLLLILARACLGLHLPGLESENEINTPLAGNQPMYLPFANFGAIPAYREPIFRDGLSRVNFEAKNDAGPDSITPSTAKTPPPTTAETTQPLDNNLELRMEQLLDKIFGTNSWKTLLQNYATETTSLPISANQQRLPNSDINAMSSGFFDNAISAGNTKQTETAPNFAITDPTRVHEIDQTNEEDKTTKSDGKYTGSFISTHLHEHKDGVSTTPSPPAWHYDIPEVAPPSREESINPFQSLGMGNQQITDTSHTAAFEGFNPNSANKLDSALFDPSTVNQLNNNYNPNQSPVIFNTQTGSNPMNQKWQVQFNADKVNSDYMHENKDDVQRNYPPGVKSDDIIDGLPHFDANNVNQDLLDSDWSISGLPTNLMSPVFLSNTLNRQETATRTHQIEIPQQHLPSQSGNSIDAGTNTNIAPKVTDKNHEETQTGVPSNRNSTASGSPRFDFIPGSISYMYPESNSQSNDHQSSQHRQPLFNPNAVNANQVVFNPNAISWIRPRALNMRSRTNRKLIYNRTTRRDAKDSNDDNGADQDVSTTPPHFGGDSERNLTDAKYSSGNSVQPTIHANVDPVDAGGAVYGGFNPNKENANQGQFNFIPGQMADGTTPNKDNGGDKDGPYKYSPDSANLNLLNFNIGSLLGVGNGGADNGANVGMSGAFNPTSLNQMMMASVSTNTSQSGTTGGVGANQFTGMSSGYNPNTAGFGGGSTFTHESGSTNGFGFDLPGNSTNFAQGAFMTGGFDANKANVGFGSVLEANSSSGFGFGGVSMNDTSAAANGGAMGFSMGGGFDPNAANTGFGSADYGMGGIGGAVGAFGGAFNADKINSGFTGKGNASEEISDLMNLFLGAKIKNEGTDTGFSGLFDSGYAGTFDPDSVNQASYNPNEFNNIKPHFDPSEMLKQNPGIGNDTLSSTGALFDPDKVNSLVKQQVFSPNAILQYGTVKEQSITSDSKIYDRNPEQTGQSNGKSDTSSALFDPFEVMKQLMGTPNELLSGYIGNRPQSTQDPTDPTTSSNSPFTSSNVTQTTGSINDVSTNQLSPMSSTVFTTATFPMSSKTANISITKSVYSTTISTPVPVTDSSSITRHIPNTTTPSSVTAPINSTVTSSI